MTIQIPGVHTLSLLTSTFLSSLTPTETSRPTALQHSIWACRCFRVCFWVNMASGGFLSLSPQWVKPSLSKTWHAQKIHLCFRLTKGVAQPLEQSTFCVRTRQKNLLFLKGFTFQPLPPDICSVIVPIALAQLQSRGGAELSSVELIMRRGLTLAPAALQPRWCYALGARSASQPGWECRLWPRRRLPRLLQTFLCRLSQRRGRPACFPAGKQKTRFWTELMAHCCDNVRILLCN